MIAIPGGDRAGVDKLYAKAIELVLQMKACKGDCPFLQRLCAEPDGNKLCFYEMKM